MNSELLISLLLLTAPPDHGIAMEFSKALMDAPLPYELAFRADTGQKSTLWESYTDKPSLPEYDFATALLHFGLILTYVPMVASLTPRLKRGSYKALAAAAMSRIR